MCTSTQGSLALIGLHPKHTHGHTPRFSSSLSSSDLHLSTRQLLSSLEHLPLYLTLGGGVQEADSKPISPKDNIAWDQNVEEFRGSSLGVPPAEAAEEGRLTRFTPCTQGKATGFEFCVFLRLAHLKCFLR